MWTYINYDDKKGFSDPIVIRDWPFTMAEITTRREEIFTFMNNNGVGYDRSGYIGLLLGFGPPENRQQMLDRLAIFSAGWVETYPGKPVKWDRGGFKIWEKSAKSVTVYFSDDYNPVEDWYVVHYELNMTSGYCRRDYCKYYK